MKKRVSAKDLDVIFPRGERQQDVFQKFYEGQNLSLLGSAGTGKTFLAMYLGLEGVLSGNYSSLCVIRSAVPTRDLGFMPGDLDEKLMYYELPYSSICDELLPYRRGWETMKESEQCFFHSTSFLRGLTLDNSVVIVDECQSMTFHELDTIITRLGSNNRIIFCGDFVQSDISNSGLSSFIRILDKLSCFSRIDFTSSDIVRGEIVRDYIIERDKIDTKRHAIQGA